jgi:hypothetical protein
MTIDTRVTLEGMYDDYDWSIVFAVANEGRYRRPYGEQYEPNLRGKPKRVEGATVNEDLFCLDDVLNIIDASVGENDGADWLVVGVLKDGRWFYIQAGCDYTGWDCRSSGHAHVGDTLQMIHQWGMTDEARQRLPLVAEALGETP